MERLSNVKAVVPRIESPYEATNKALMTKHAALSHQGPAKVKKVKLPPVIHARAKGYVKDIDDEFLKTEADRLERMYKGIASQNPHLFKKKRMKFKERNVSSSLRQEGDHSLRDGTLKSMSQPLDRTEGGKVIVHRPQKGSIGSIVTNLEIKDGQDLKQKFDGGQTIENRDTNFTKKVDSSQISGQKDGYTNDKHSNHTSPSVPGPTIDSTVAKTHLGKENVAEKDHLHKDNDKLNIKVGNDGRVTVKPDASEQGLKASQVGGEHKDQHSRLTGPAADPKGSKNDILTNKLDQNPQPSKDKSAGQKTNTESDGNLVEGSDKKSAKDNKSPPLAEKDKPKVDNSKKPSALDDLPDDFFDNDGNKETQGGKKDGKQATAITSKPAISTKPEQKKDAKPETGKQPVKDAKKDDLDDFFGELDPPKKTPADSKTGNPASKPGLGGTGGQKDGQIAKPATNKQPDPKAKPAKEEDLDDVFGDLPKEKDTKKPIPGQSKPQVKPADKKVDEIEKKPEAQAKNPETQKDQQKPATKKGDDLDDFFDEVPKAQDVKKPIPAQNKPQVKPADKKVDEIEKKPEAQEVLKDQQKPATKKGDDLDDFFDEVPKAQDVKKPIPAQNKPQVKPADKKVEAY
jgi:tetrahydromethanopterin S-methyltransferase subunit F